jgi:eukaryotic-like serine/threonine-protein kinase
VNAGSQVAARQLDVLSGTPGYKAAIYASNTVPPDIGGWKKVSGTLTGKLEQPFPLDTAGKRFRNYLLWISELPEGGKVTVKELALKK